MRSRITLFLILLAALSAGCKKPNPHDNARVPEPFSDKPVYNHRFDGGETNPYFKPGEGGSSSEGGGEKKGGGGEKGGE